MTLPLWHWFDKLRVCRVEWHVQINLAIKKLLHKTHHFLVRVIQMHNTADLHTFCSFSPFICDHLWPLRLVCCHGNICWHGNTVMVLSLQPISFCYHSKNIIATLTVQTYYLASFWDSSACGHVWSPELCYDHSPGVLLWILSQLACCHYGNG